MLSTSAGLSIRQPLCTFFATVGLPKWFKYQYGRQKQSDDYAAFSTVFEAAWNRGLLSVSAIFLTQGSQRQ